MTSGFRSIPGIHPALPPALSTAPGFSLAVTASENQHPALPPDWSPDLPVNRSEPYRTEMNR